MDSSPDTPTLDMETETSERGGPEKLIARIAGAIGALGLIAGSTIAVISNTVLHSSPSLFKAISVCLNLVVLIIYCFLSTRVPRLELKEGAEVGRNYCELLKVQLVNEKPDYSSIAALKVNRVNRLVAQLHNLMIGYAVALIVVYLLYLFDNQSFFDNYLLPQKYYHQYISAGIKVVIGIFNYLSAVFLYLAFIVLYDKTIEPDDVTPIRFQRKAWIFSVVFLVGYLIFSVTFVTDFAVGTDPVALIQNVKSSIRDYETKTNTTASDGYKRIQEISKSSPDDKVPAQQLMVQIDKVNTSYKNANKASASGSIEEVDKKIADYKNSRNQIIFNILYLFIGICNGLAMTLLFGRYVSMEHSVFSMEGAYRKRKYSKLLHFFTIYVLPLYALAQPLFGSFEIDAFGPRETFANGVFFVCWIGKIGFLYLTHIFMKERLMHLYLHTGVNYRGIPQKLFECFKFDSEQ